MTPMLSMPGGLEWISIAEVLMPWILGITAVLDREHETATRIVFVLLCIFIPIFSIGYWLYSLSKKKADETKSFAKGLLYSLIVRRDTGFLFFRYGL